METYDMAILGVGSSAAYYLSTFDKSREYVETVVEGKVKSSRSWFITTIVAVGWEDPWKEARGHNPEYASKFVNHTYHLIKHNSDSVADYTDEKALVDRKEWAAANQAIIDKVATNVIKAKIKTVENGVVHPDPQKQGCKYFKITLDERADAGDAVIYARKVVVATGAGVEGKGTEFHQRPDWVTKAMNEGPLDSRLPANKVMDMDEFVRGDSEKGSLMDGRNQTAIIFGHNAGIDAAQDAYERKFSVRWFGSDEPVFLAGESYQSGARKIHKNTEGHSYHYFDPRNNPPKLKKVGAKIQVDFKHKTTGKDETVEGDFVVYAMGQQRGQKVTPYLSLELLKTLEPIYDVNQRFGASQERVLALQLPDQNSWNNLEVIGAATKQLLDGVDLKHNYLSRCELVQGLTGIQVRIKDRFSIIERTALEYLRDAMTRYADFYDLAGKGLKLKVVKSQARHFMSYLTVRVNHYPVEDRNVILVTGESLVNVFQKCLETIDYFKAMLQPNQQKLSGDALAAALKSIKVSGPDNDKAITKIMPRSVAASAQLVAIKEMTAAQLGAVPESVGSQKVERVGNALKVTNVKGKTNLSTDDRQMLRVYIAVNYPDIEDGAELTRIMDQIINARREQDRPWGIDGKDFNLDLGVQKLHWQIALETLEKNQQAEKAVRIP